MRREKPKWQPHKGLSTDARHRGGWACSSVEVPVMGMERRSPLTLFHQLVNCAIRRNRLMQRGLWSGEKSRMSREAPVRFCEGLGVQFPRATRLIITGTSKELLRGEVQPLVAHFLKERGLELSHEKTSITHMEDGFDFLGQNVRRYGR